MTIYYTRQTAWSGHTGTWYYCMTMNDYCMTMNDYCMTMNDYCMLIVIFQFKF